MPCRLADPFAEAAGLQNVPTHSEAQGCTFSTGRCWGGRADGEGPSFQLGLAVLEKKKGDPSLQVLPSPIM